MGGLAGQRSLDGIVVGTRDYAESDRIVDLLTAAEGRVALLARGGRASRRRFAGALDLFVSLRAQVVPRGELWSLHAADVLDARVGIRASLEGIGRAATLVEVARSLTPEHQEAAAVHAALAAALDRVAAGDVAGAATAYPRLLQVAGLLPDLGRCAACGTPEPAVLAGAALLCGRCGPGRLPLAPAVLAVLRGASCTDVAVASAVESAVAELVEVHIGKPLRSWRRPDPSR